MKWNRYSIKTTTQAVDLISSALDDIGIEGIEIQDNVQLTQEEAKTMFVDFIPELPPDDGTAVVNFYIDSDEDDGTLVKKAEQEIKDLRMFVDIGEGCSFLQMLTICNKHPDNLQLYAFFSSTCRNHYRFYI